MKEGRTKVKEGIDESEGMKEGKDGERKERKGGTEKERKGKEG